jgi:hypothetical protein
MVDRLAVVRVGAAIEQQTRQRCVMRHAGGAVERRLVLRRLAGAPEATVGIGAGIEQRGRCPDEGVRARGVEPQILGQAEMRQRVRPVGPAACVRPCRIARKMLSQGGVIAQDRRDVDVAVGQLGIGQQHRLGTIERAVPGARHDERGPPIGH